MHAKWAGLMIAACCGDALAQSEEELAKKLANPVAAMISVPLQYNYDHEIGPARDGSKSVLNIQPVIPFTLNDEWNVISRTILPVISQEDVSPGSGKVSGIGDITQSLFFVPRKSSGGLIWGVGPAFLIPLGSDDHLSARKWGVGPTAIVLKQEAGLTFGFLANHIWGNGGDTDRADVSSTFFQPFLSHTTKTAWTYGVNVESSYDWKAKQWLVAVNFTVAKLTKVGGMPMSFTAGARYWADSTDNGPHGWGIRLAVTFLFPQ